MVNIMSNPRIISMVNMSNPRIISMVNIMSNP